MSQLGPIDYAVISQALIAAAREMGVKLIRSAYSTILREARDGSAGLMDRDGNTVAQAELIPMQLGPIGKTLRACLRRQRAMAYRRAQTTAQLAPPRTALGQVAKPKC
jgi:N-methylhydantoinase B